MVLFRCARKCFLYEKRGVIMKKIAMFFHDVKREMKKVKWPTKKEMKVYSVATLTFILVFAIFFVLTDLVLAFIQAGMVK